MFMEARRKKPPKSPRREKMWQEPRLKLKHVPTRLYKLIEIGRKIKKRKERLFKSLDDVHVICIRSLLYPPSSRAYSSEVT